MLVFFDDILIYNSSLYEHLQHVRVVMNVLRGNNFHVKRSKCSFATTSVSYLGHVISSEGVAMDTAKVDSVQSWPQPKSARGLQGFLGLAGYYKKFIQNFGAMAAPLTQLLKQQGFQWTEEATTTFVTLK
jgi:hypothetical protein